MSYEGARKVSHLTRFVYILAVEEIGTLSRESATLTQGVTTGLLIHDHGGATTSPGETVARTVNSSHLIQNEAHTRFLRDSLTLGQDGWCEVLQVSVFARYHERFPSKSIL